MAESWFHEGLRFSCTRCGACCTGAPGYVWVSEQEVVQIAEFRGQSVDEFSRSFVRLVGTALSLTEEPSGDCVFYDRGSGGCSIYPVRPRQCRTWPFWRSNLRTKGAWQETCRVCPGAGKGELHSREAIEGQMEVIRL